jgi:hypothetical protein
VCCVTALGPISRKNANTRSERDQLRTPGAEPPIAAGLHYTLYYTQLLTQAEHLSSVTEILHWIQIGPILPPNVEDPNVNGTLPITTPPATALLYVPMPQPTAAPAAESLPLTVTNSGPLVKSNEQMSDLNTIPVTKAAITPPITSIASHPGLMRKSTRNRTTRDFLKPKFKGKAYNIGEQRVYNCKEQRVPACYSDVDENWYLRPMSKSTLPPAFRRGPLNLNEDGTKINYKKSHAGQYKVYWEQADAEEIVRLLISSTIRPLHFREIPLDQVVTYVNPVCVEKLNDDSSLKFRTRLTIGGDRIIYPYDKSAVTADLESWKILLNCMISEDANWSTIDLTDFYLGTPLPHPEYIRIPTAMIPERVRKFYALDQYITSKAIYFSVHRTHYGLPQAGALSQQRLFKHLEQNGYSQCQHTPSFFRNKDGSVRFSLVVDDFAILWTNKQSMDHFIATLRQLYSVKINWEGTKYIGMDIDIDRKNRHVTISMAGYIDKLFQTIRPNGTKGASTPCTYAPPNYKNPGAQTATIDDTPLATLAQKKELQSVIGTLLYYSRTVDPSILTAVHELGSVQANPTIKDMLKMERLLQYLSTHRNYGIRYYASNMQLQVQSDASYLCRPRARSVSGGLFYLGTRKAINGSIACTSKMISCIVASAAEAELAAGFQQAQIAVRLRNTLTDLGYPQLPTLLLIDNTVAIGLANDTINKKRSKSMDMRFFWLRDRVAQQQFVVEHIPGQHNVADFFTKALPKSKYDQFRRYLVVNRDCMEEKRPKKKLKTITMDKTL